MYRDSLIILQFRPDGFKHTHDPVIEKPSKTFSIKDILSDNSQPAVKIEKKSLVEEPEVHLEQLEED